MGLFKGVNNARPNMGSNYARTGHYLALIRRVKQDKTRKDVEFVAVEMVNLKTIAAGPSEDPHRVGEQFSWLVMSDKDSFSGNIKAFIMNVAGVQDHEVGEEECVKVVSEEQPFGGLIVELNNRLIQTKAGKPFTLVNFVRTLSPDEVREAISQEILEQVLTKAERERYLPPAPPAEA